MLSLNNILPLFGALVPALYQSRSSIQTNVQLTFGIKFTYNLMWALFVVIVSCLTIHVEILNYEIVWIGKVINNISMTTVHYIVVCGFGTLFLINFVFGLMIDHFNIDYKYAWIPFFIINSINIVCTTHILFIDYFFEIRG